jgi:hypothetical protein
MGKDNIPPNYGIKRSCQLLDICFYDGGVALNKKLMGF